MDVGMLARDDLDKRNIFNSRYCENIEDKFTPQQWVILPQ